MSGPTSKPSRRKIPITVALIVPFISLTVLAIGLAGYISFLNGKKAVNEVASQLRSEITLRIDNHLRTFLNTPQQINQLNSQAMQDGLLDANNPKALRRHFWQQVNVFNSVSSVYFGNTAGGLVNSGREGASGAQYVIETADFSKGTFRKYATDKEGKPTKLLVTVPEFDATGRAWYRDAVEKGSGLWSPVYILFTGQDMAVAASRPVYDQGPNLLGVVSVDIFLSQISHFLQNLTIGKTGNAFIFDRAGLLIASSSQEKLFNLQAANGQQRLRANQSSTPMISQAINALNLRFSGFEFINNKEDIEFSINGKRQFLQVSPLEDEYGLNWLIAVVIPETDFLAQIKANNQITVLLTVCALITVILIGFFTARIIIKPILQLSKSAQNLTADGWKNNLVDNSGLVEISALTSSFNQMSDQLHIILRDLNDQISERLRIEAELRENREQLAAILKAIPDPIAVYDVNGFPVYLNPSFTKLFGWTIAEFEGERIPFVPTDEEEVTRSKIKDIYQTEKPVKFETKRFNKRGSTIDILISAAIIKDIEKNHRGLVVILKDISARKLLEEELRQAHKMESIGTLTGGIAHDFNNILSIIIGNAELALEDIDYRHPSRFNLEEIKTASLKAADIVKQLLSYSRKSGHNLSPLVLDPIIKETLQLLRATIPTTIEIRKNLTVSDKMILADPVQINQIIMNLCINSYHAMENSGGILDISVDYITLDRPITDEIYLDQLQDGDYVRISVSDTGPGIDAQVIDRIFDPYFTTKEIGKGSGMGLSVVQGIVKNHGGTITVENCPEGGASFVIYFPLISGTAEPNDSDVYALGTTK